MSKTGSKSVFSFGFAPTVEITSKKCFTASICFSVQNFLYNCPVYSSLHGCWADRELTKLPNDCIVLDIRVRVRFVWKSYKYKNRHGLAIKFTAFQWFFAYEGCFQKNCVRKYQRILAPQYTRAFVCVSLITFFSKRQTVIG